MTDAGMWLPPHACSEGLDKKQALPSVGIKNKGKVMYDVSRTYSRNDLSRIADFGKLKETL